MNKALEKLDELAYIQNIESGRNIGDNYADNFHIIAKCLKAIEIIAKHYDIVDLYAITDEKEKEIVKEVLRSV